MVRSNSANAPVIWNSSFPMGVVGSMFQVEVEAGRPEVLNRAQVVDQGPPRPVDSPNHHDVELVAAGVLEHGIKAVPLVL